MMQFNRKKAMKAIAAIGAVSAVVTVVASVFSGWFLFKLVRYLDTAQKALPKIEKASQLYIENNSKTKED